VQRGGPPVARAAGAVAENSPKMMSTTVITFFIVGDPPCRSLRLPKASRSHAHRPNASQPSAPIWAQQLLLLVQGGPPLAEAGTIAAENSPRAISTTVMARVMSPTPRPT
jgi:hypothetical protein